MYLKYSRFNSGCRSGCCDDEILDCGALFKLSDIYEPQTDAILSSQLSVFSTSFLSWTRDTLPSSLLTQSLSKPENINKLKE